MYKLASMFVFSMTLFIGISCLPVKTQTIYERFYPNFTRKEADSLLGRRVKNIYFDESSSGYGMKYPLNAEENFIVEAVEVGETGQVIALQEINQGFILFIKWDKQNKFGKDMFSYYGRFSSRTSLEFE
jgi:hypothetical protein